jgi:hypothetical protein
MTLQFFIVMTEGRCPGPSHRCLWAEALARGTTEVRSTVPKWCFHKKVHFELNAGLSRGTNRGAKRLP